MRWRHYAVLLLFPGPRWLRDGGSGRAMSDAGETTVTHLQIRHQRCSRRRYVLLAGWGGAADTTHRIAMHRLTFLGFYSRSV